jgi:HAD superfamily hydrolase (TIGR01509 family)
MPWSGDEAYVVHVLGGEDDMNGLRGVIFDVDGTLVDSNDAHAHAWVASLREAGHAVPFERVRPLIGMGGDKLLPSAAGVSADSAEGQQIGQRRGAIFRERFLPRLRPFAGAPELVRELKARGLRLGVASSAEEEDLRLLLEIAGAASLLDVRTSGDDAKSSKPDPDVVTAALRRLGCAADETVMIGDTPYDVAAARAAGVGCLAFRCGGWDDQGLAGAIAVYEGPLDLLRRLDASPLAGPSPAHRAGG